MEQGKEHITIAEIITAVSEVYGKDVEEVIEWNIDKITAMFLHHRKRKMDEYEILLSPYIDKKKSKLNKPSQDVLFLSAEDYEKMTPEERAEKQKAMEMHWTNFNPIG